MSLSETVASAASQSKTNMGIMVGIIVPLIVCILGFIIKNRKLTMDYNTGLRAEFIAEMHALRDEVKSLRDENEGLRMEVKGLRNEGDMLRIEIRELHSVIDGMRREGLAGSISGQRAMIDTFPEGAVPPATRAALDALDRVPGGANEGRRPRRKI